MKLRYIYKSILFISLSIIGCEDDPLLGPQVSECLPGDSYCEITIPSSKKDSNIKNPEIF